ncbi:MAG: LON peptidase substrate-binding domain-containing protein [Pseudomonadota bacterium]|nr:LON peptidase substrate-binding domain-containing protein [Pseudomonadota bacterium]
MEMPLFPLNTVLFPDGLLPLRIFEPRYLDMVGESLRTGSGFGVVLIAGGGEVGGDARFHPFGTVARIIDFDRLEDGLLGITCQGGERFRVLDHRQRADRLVIAEVELLPAEPRLAVPADCALAVRLLRSVLSLDEVQVIARRLRMDWDSASWVGFRLADLLPLPLAAKQSLLEAADPLQRLQELQAVIRTYAR